MSTKQRKLMKAALCAIISSGLALTATQTLAKKNDMERCYGVAKAGQNGCGTGFHQCQGKSKNDGDPDDWISLPKGTCDKIINGSTTPGAD